MSVAPVLPWPQPPRRIAVFRASSPVGLLPSVPALRALREAFPHAHITLIGLPEAQAFVQRFHRYLDDLLAFPALANEVPVEKELSRFYAIARARHFDVAIQLQDGAAIWNHIVAHLGSSYWAGFASQDARGTLMDASEDMGGTPGILMPWPEHLSEVLRYTALIQYLGIRVRSTALEVPLHQNDLDTAAQIFQSAGLNPRQTIILYPGTTEPAEGWPPASYARLAQELVAHGWQIVIAGREEDRPTTQRLRAALRCLVVDLTGQITTGSFAAMLTQCRLLICNHPLASQLAVAMHTPSVVLASGSDRNQWLLPDSELHTVLWPSTGDSARTHDTTTDTIDVDLVLLHARYKLGMGSAFV